jgi:hypothetical protein
MSKATKKPPRRKSPPAKPLPFAVLRDHIRTWLAYHHPKAVDVQLVVMNPAGYSEHEYRIVGFTKWDEAPPPDPA